MNYNIIAVPTFKKELKRLAKKYPSLKNELAVLFELLQIQPTQGTPLGNNCLKYALLLLLKARVKKAAQELSQTLYLQVRQFFYFLFMTNPKKKTLLIKNSMNY